MFIKKLQTSIHKRKINENSCFKWNEKKNSDDPGLVSLCLTFLNILCIIITGILILRIKVCSIYLYYSFLFSFLCLFVTPCFSLNIYDMNIQEVTPEKIPQSFSEFWKKDVRARRGKYNRIQDQVISLHLFYYKYICVFIFNNILLWWKGRSGWGGLAMTARDDYVEHG